MMYLLIECVVLITFNVLLCSSTPSNAWLTMSSTNLPSTPLFGFAVGIYNRTLHIVGGSSSPQSSPLSTTVYSNSIYPYNITNYTLIDFNSDDGSSSWQSIPDVVDPRFELGFKCKGQCYSAHREYLYIVNPESLFFDETGYLVIYNMATSTFIAPSTFNGSLIFPEAGSCATNNGSHLFAIGSKCRGCNEGFTEIQSYDMDSNGPWRVIANMSIGRYYSGCSVDGGGDYIYIFGGYSAHNESADFGFVTKDIERCSLFESHMQCEVLWDIELSIGRAEHEVVLNRDNLMFIIGGFNSEQMAEQIVEVFDVEQNRMLGAEWHSVISKGLTHFGAFYDSVWDIVYVIGGMDNDSQILDSIQYLPGCVFSDNCYAQTVNLECGDTIYESIAAPHQIHSFYFGVDAADNISAIVIDGCESQIDSYLLTFFWNATVRQFRSGQLYDDAGQCQGHFQERVTIENPKYGLYHLAVSAHEAGQFVASFECLYGALSSTDPIVGTTTTPTLSTVSSTESMMEETSEFDVNSTVFALDFVCRAVVDLRKIHWRELIVNALITALQHGLDDDDDINGEANTMKGRHRLETMTAVHGTLTFLENEDEALLLVGRRLLSDVMVEEDGGYHFNVELNVTTMSSIIDEEESYLCGSTFFEAFSNGLKADIETLQIYAIASCDESVLADTWRSGKEGDSGSIGTAHGDEKGLQFAVDEIHIVVIAVLCGVLLGMSMIGVVMEKVKGTNSLRVDRLALWCLCAINGYSDVLFAVHWWLEEGAWSGLFSVCIGCTAICIVIVPILFSLHHFGASMMEWRSDLVHGTRLSEWFAEFGKVLFVLMFVSCSTFGAMELVDCCLYGIRLFSIGLPPAARQRFRRRRCWLILLGDIPQCIVQLVLIGSRLRSDCCGLFALCASAISIGVYLGDLCGSFHYNDVDAKSMLVSWRISSLSIVCESDLYRNKLYIFKSFLAEKLNIDHRTERVDLLPIVQYFDTDIGGLTVSFILSTTNSTGRERQCVCDTLQQLIDCGAMSKHITSEWALPAHEDVHCYKLSALSNVSYHRRRHSMELSSVKQSRLSRHIKMNSGSVDIAGGMTMEEMPQSEESTSEFDETSEEEPYQRHSVSPQWSHKDRTKRDFVVLNTKDDADGFVPNSYEPATEPAVLLS